MKRTLVTSEGGTPSNDLLLAVNLYVSTGDRVGEGVWLQDPAGRITFIISYRPTSSVDSSDFKKFRSRVGELKANGFPIELTFAGQDSAFDFWLLQVWPHDIIPMAAELISHDGKAGQGSMADMIWAWYPNQLLGIVAARDESWLSWVPTNASSSG